VLIPNLRERCHDAPYPRERPPMATMAGAPLPVRATWNDGTPISAIDHPVVTPSPIRARSRPSRARPLGPRDQAARRRPPRIHTTRSDDGIAMGHDGNALFLPSRERRRQLRIHGIQRHCADEWSHLIENKSPPASDAAMRLNIPFVFVSRSDGGR